MTVCVPGPDCGLSVIDPLAVTLGKGPPIPKLNAPSQFETSIVNDPPLATVGVCVGHNGDTTCALTGTDSAAPNTTSTAIAIHRAIAKRKTDNFMISRSPRSPPNGKGARGEP